MIVKMNGDILESKCDIICHQVNCKGVMGAGLAKQIRAKYPKVFEQYSAYVNSHDSCLGSCQYVSVSTDGSSPRYICNMFGQDGYGKGLQTDYEALKNCINDVYLLASEKNLSVAIPYGIGCGLAGGDWNKVEQMIEERFGCSRVYCYIYKL